MGKVRAHDDHAQEAQRRITEDDPRWNPKSMGNKKGKVTPKPSMRYYKKTKYQNA